VVFQPFKDGKPSGPYEVFADGFSGSPAKTAAGRADHKPCGLAQGPHGSLFVSDEIKEPFTELFIDFVMFLEKFVRVKSVWLAKN
jgi:glucose/arabinose dehydrogenase